MGVRRSGRAREGTSDQSTVAPNNRQRRLSKDSTSLIWQNRERVPIRGAGRGPMGRGLPLLASGGRQTPVFVRREQGADALRSPKRIDRPDPA